jgi:hypothetical protein
MLLVFTHMSSRQRATIASESTSAAESSRSTSPVERQYARDDFEFGSLLGIGALAQVVHVKDIYSDEEYALKIIDKKRLRQVRVMD